MDNDDQRLARYECIVHASNRAPDYGVSVSVLAATIQEARDRAIALGWSGRASDARVAVVSVTDVQESTMGNLDAAMFALHPDRYLCRCGATYSGQPESCTCPSDFPEAVIADLSARIKELEGRRKPGSRMRRVW